jgi:predicted dehydrogenase
LWQIEVYGSKGAVQFELTENNLLQYFSLDDPLETQGFRTILVTEAEVHDWIKNWWPPGHMLGWEHHHCNTIFHFVNCIANNLDVAPWGATFDDGLEIQRLLTALELSNKEKSWIPMEQI